MSKNKGLGQGLSALFSNDLENFDEAGLKVIDVDINKIEPNKEQPRKRFDEEKLAELAKSIEEMGIIQPLVVKDMNGYYEIIAGERRWRAARAARLKTVPVIVREYTDLETLEVALIENIQREDLNPLEEAFTYKKFSEEFNLNQEEIAKKVGKSRTTVANSIRLLNLDKRVQNFLRENKLTSGHARALLAIQDGEAQFLFAEKIIEEQLSVRETENAIREFNQEKDNTANEDKKKKDTPNSEIYKEIAKNINDILGTKVTIKNGRNKGKIEIEYYSEDELDRLVCMFNKLR